MNKNLFWKEMYMKHSLHLYYILKSKVLSTKKYKKILFLRLFYIIKSQFGAKKKEKEK